MTAKSIDFSPADKIRISIDRDILKKLSAPAPGFLLVHTLLEWLAIIGMTLLATHYSNAFLSLTCMVLIASRQHALLALMHEYSHYQFSRSRPLLNDLIGDVFTAFPFFITVHGFRRNHLPHHRYVATDKDPNWMTALRKDRYQFPKSRGQLAAQIVKHFIGWYSLADLKGYTVDAGMAINLQRVTKISRLVYFTMAIVAITYLHAWVTILLYWILPLSTFLMGMLYLRDMGEHYGMPVPGIAGSRTVQASYLERLFISPYAVNFHTEHHLYPAVPFFRLKRLHQLLMHNANYRKNALITQGYIFGLLLEVVTPKAEHAGAINEDLYQK